MYRAITDDIEVNIEPFYIEEQSDPEESRYVWIYRVSIANHSQQTVQLRSRYWKITDATGKIEEVSGDGVVGEEPYLAPGDSYQYSSGCPLSTPSGFMQGHYIMEKPDGTRFNIRIPAFSLDIPNGRRVLN